VRKRIHLLACPYEYADARIERIEGRRPPLPQS
jgi:hypothetical protein